MRISDWSSDVCSSDLVTLGTSSRMDRSRLQLSGLHDHLVMAGNTPRSCQRMVLGPYDAQETAEDKVLGRSDERRVGQECVSTCRSRWSPYPSKNKIQYTAIKCLYIITILQLIH